MKRVVSDFKIVICPNCQGCGQLSHYDKDRERCKIVNGPCNLCLGTGRVKRRVTIDYYEFLESVL